MPDDYEELRDQLVNRLDMHVELVHRIEQALAECELTNVLPGEVRERIAEYGARGAGAVVGSMPGPTGPGASPEGGPFITPPPPSSD